MSITLGNAGRFFYLGWNRSSQNGDESFGVSVFNCYAGFYKGKGWFWGLLDSKGCL